MNRKLKTLLLSALLLSAMVPATAQRWVEITDGATPVICISETVNEAPDVVEIFQNTQSGYFHDARAPRFILVDQEGKWGLGIGGYLQTKIEYDFDRAVDNVDFLPSAIYGKGGPESQLQMDLTNSTLFMKLVGTSRLLGDFVVYTSGNWRGSALGFQLLNAYMSTKYLKFGYGVGSFMDIEAVPTTIDYGGPCGMTFYRTTQVMLRYAFDWGLSMGVSLENPDVSIEKNELISVNAQRVPNVPVYVQYDLKGNSNNHIRLGAVMRDMYYTDNVANKNSDKVGWGAQASLLTTMGGLQLLGQFTIGEGIGSMINNVSNIGVDIVPDPESPGKAMLLRSESWYAGMQYNFSKKFMMSATYSQTALHSQKGYAEYNPKASRKGQYVVANALYNLTDNLQIGIEYLHGWRTNFDETISNANRVNLSARYDF